MCFKQPSPPPVPEEDPDVKAQREAAEAEAQAARAKQKKAALNNEVSRLSGQGAGIRSLTSGGTGGYGPRSMTGV